MSEPHEAWMDVHTNEIIGIIPARPQRVDYDKREYFAVALKVWCHENAIANRIHEAGKEGLAQDFNWSRHLGLGIDEGEA